MFPMASNIFVRVFYLEVFEFFLLLFFVSRCTSIEYFSMETSVPAFSASFSSCKSVIGHVPCWEETNDASKYWERVLRWKNFSTGIKDTKPGMGRTSKFSGATTRWFNFDLLSRVLINCRWFVDVCGLLCLRIGVDFV